ncbi:MAG TPA: PfkB family carbohydrate kinase, partial [Gemmataceae bacterium]|nr:PfkB family carbohydrate kinase [Gemmataceae bacterium]
MSSLDAVLDPAKRARILVVGDLMLDRYTWGDAERVSPEGPVIVLRADRTEERLGGAAAVAQLLTVLEAEVNCAGAVADDAAGRAVRQLLGNAGITCRHVLFTADRATTTKERFLGRAAGKHAQQMLRVDREANYAIPEELENRLCEELLPLGDYDAVLIADYGKGVCTPMLCQRLIQAASVAGVPVVVDPCRTAEYERYRGATAVTPNRLETQLVSRRQILEPGDALAIGKDLCLEWDLSMVLVTLDRDGIVMVRKDGTGSVFPTRARAVYDITGAGDTVLATVGLALAKGAPAEIAVQLANFAAGLQVERIGVSVVSLSELRAATMGQPTNHAKVVNAASVATIVQQHRDRGRTIVFTNGCFDLLHTGHIHYLAEAAELGDLLVVGLNSDASIRRLKGPERPVLSQEERAAMLAALETVGLVV